MKELNDIVNWLIQSGYLVAVIIFAWQEVKPILQAKQKHAKTVQEKELLGLINSLADNAVSSLVGAHGVTGHDKFKAG